MSEGFVLKSGKTSEAVPKAKVAPIEQSKAANSETENYGKSKWHQERIWTEAIEKEARVNREWQEKWSFLTEYDPKGNIKVKKQLPDKVTMFSQTLPSSMGHEYGHRYYTKEAQVLKDMQNSFYTNFRKQRNSALISD